MSTIPWQTIIALMCVAASMAYLLRRLYRAMISPNNSSCNQCAGAPVTGIRQMPLVPIESLTRSRGGTPDSPPHATQPDAAETGPR